MAILETVFKIPTKAQIAYLKLDASISESHTRTATVSKTEIESGTKIANHIVLGEEGLSMSCIVSDVPISILGLGVSQDDFLGAARDFSNGDKNAFEGLVKSPTRTPKDAWKYLEQVWRSRQPFSVVTSLQRYENMAITNLTAPRKADDGKSLVFEIQMEKIRIIKSAKTQVAALKIKGPDKGGASKTDLGKQAGKGASEEQTDNSSLLFKGFKKAGIL